MALDEPLPDDAGARNPNALRAGMHLAVGDDNLAVGDTTRGGYLTGWGIAVTFGHRGSRHLHLGRRDRVEAEPHSLGDGGGAVHNAAATTTSSKAHERLPVEAYADDDIDDGRRGTVEVESHRLTAEAVGRRGAAEGRQSAVRRWVETATGSPFINPPQPSAAAWEADEAARAEAEACIGRRAAARGEVAAAWRELEGSEAARAKEDRAALATAEAAEAAEATEAAEAAEAAEARAELGLDSASLPEWEGTVETARAAEAWGQYWDGRPVGASEGAARQGRQAPLAPRAAALAAAARATAAASGAAAREAAAREVGALGRAAGADRIAAADRASDRRVAMGGMGELAWALTEVEVEAGAEAQAARVAAREAATAEAAAAAESALAAEAAAEVEAASGWQLGGAAVPQAAERRAAVAKEGYTGHRLCRYSGPRSNAEGQRSSRALEVCNTRTPACMRRAAVSPSRHTSYHRTQALSRPLEASLVYGTGVRRDPTGTSAFTTALGHASGAREVLPQDTCYLSAGGGGAGGGGAGGGGAGAGGAASDTARRHAANFEYYGARRGGGTALARGAAARGGAATAVAAARCGEKLAGAVRAAERAEGRMGRGAAWEGREAGVLPVATAEAAASASRAAHVAVFGGDGGGGRSSTAIAIPHTYSDDCNSDYTHCDFTHRGCAYSTYYGGCTTGRALRVSGTRSCTVEHCSLRAARCRGSRRGYRRATAARGQSTRRSIRPTCSTILSEVQVQPRVFYIDRARRLLSHGHGVDQRSEPVTTVGAKQDITNHIQVGSGVPSKTSRPSCFP
jgi:hypothetical protein